MTATSIPDVDLVDLDRTYRSLGLEATYQIEALVQVLLREAAAFDRTTTEDQVFDTMVKSVALRIDALNTAAMSIFDHDATHQTFRVVTGKRAELQDQKLVRAATATRGGGQHA